MKIAIFGSTGDLGQECLNQALADGHETSLLVRDAGKLSAEQRERSRVVEGNALDPEAVQETLTGGVEVVLFAIGVDSGSPENLCTDVTGHILSAMRQLDVRRFIWCGGGATLVPDDVVTFGARFVRWYGNTFMGLNNRDKDHQFELLEKSRDVEWVGVRPLQMIKGPQLSEYRIGFHRFSGMSKIHFADCAHGMLSQLSEDTWLHRAPIIQY